MPKLFTIWLWTWITALIVFYGVIVIAMASWDRIPTLDLLSVYATQAGAMLATFGARDIAFFVVGVVLLIAASSLLTRWIVVSAKKATHVDSDSTKRRNPRSQREAVIAFGCVAIAMLFLFVNSLDPRTRWSKDYFHSFVQASDRVPVSEALLPVLSRIGDPNRRKTEDQIREAYKPVTLAKRPNVVIIAVDALRPDHLSANGYSRDTTPKLAALVRSGQAVIQREARSACAESSCGILSMLSGRHAHELLTQSFDLPSVLALHGYRRIFALSGDHTNFYSLRRAYGEIEHYWDGSMSGGYANDDRLLLKHIAALPNVSADKPHFMYLHLMSTHGLGKREAEFNRWTPNSSPYGGTAALFLNLADNEMRTSYVNNYDNGVLQTDSIFAQLIAELTRKGYLASDSVLILTADHGESLGDHGVLTHAEGVHESVLKIPLVWLGALGSSINVDRAATHADIAPTALAHIGIPIPKHWSGNALQRDQQLPQQSMTIHLQAPQAAVIGYENGVARYKYQRNLLTNTQHYFDLQSDPQEKKPLAKLDVAHPIANSIDALFANLRLDQLIARK
ncbi:MAG: sulfatase-like hydrolase/transferase [Casimicrobium sp.]